MISLTETNLLFSVGSYIHIQMDGSDVLDVKYPKIRRPIREVKTEVKRSIFHKEYLPSSFRALRCQ